MANKHRYKVKEIEDALRDNMGFLSQAAKKLGCCYHTVYKYIQNNDRLKQVQHEVKEKQIDFAESKLLEQIRDGNLGAIIFYLKCQAKHRGYVERTESMQHHTGELGIGALVVPSEMTPEEWEKVFASDKTDKENMG